MIHFRDTKLFRVGLKFTNVSFARVRQITSPSNNAKIEGWGEGGYIRKVRTQGRGVPRKSMHAYKGEGGGLIFDILVCTYYVNDP